MDKEEAAVKDNNTLVHAAQLNRYAYEEKET